MSIGSVIRGIGSGASRVGHAVQAVSKSIDKPFAPSEGEPDVNPIAQPLGGADANGDGTITPAEKRAWETAGHALTPSTVNGVKGFDYPDIENPTIGEEPNPFYIPKTRKNAEGGEESNPDYTEAAMVHANMDRLDKIHTEANPHIDFAREYEQIMAEQKRNDGNKSHSGNAVSSFLIGVGGGQRAQDKYNEQSREADAQAAAERDKSLQFKKSLVDAHVKQLVEEGKWKEALKGNEVSANITRLLKQGDDRRQHEYKMEENKQLMGGRKEVADTRARSAIVAAQTRVDGIAAQHGLRGEFLKAFYTQMGKAMGGLAKGIMNDPDAGIAAAPGLFDAAADLAAKLEGDQGAAPTAASGKKVQMMKDGKPIGAPISPEDFMKRGGAAAAQAHGYTFQMQ